MVTFLTVFAFLFGCGLTALIMYRKNFQGQLQVVPPQHTPAPVAPAQAAPAVTTPVVQTQGSSSWSVKKMGKPLALIALIAVVVYITFLVWNARGEIETLGATFIERAFYFDGEDIPFILTILAVGVITLLLSRNNGKLAKALLTAVLAVAGAAIVATVLLSGLWKWWYGEHSSEVLIHQQNENAQAVLNPKQSVGHKGRAVKQRIISVEFTIPAMGIVVVQKELRCFVDINPLARKVELGVTREDKGTVIVYRSTHEKDIEEKMWFFDEGGPCEEDYKMLLAERAFI